jgi:hypothetical protein
MYARTAWSAEFPDVIVHAPLAQRDAHPSYALAKAGNSDAAVTLVGDLLNPTALAQLVERVGSSHPLLTAVSALEINGFNAIPDALSAQISLVTGWAQAPGEIRQVNKVAHTRAGGWHRLATQAVFLGQVHPGALYVLVDDHVGFGGTLANLKGYIETNGGQVLAMTTLTETSDARRIALRAQTLNLLKIKHGSALQDAWIETFNYGLEFCTELEAAYLCRQRDVDTIRRRLAKAAKKARLRGVQPTALSAGNAHQQ